MPKVRLTLDPDTEVEVSEQENTDLTRWGLVVDSKSKSTTDKKEG